MNFLIIDDDDYKVQNFTKYLSKKDTYTIKQSYNSGLRELFLNTKVTYDCIVLDMNFPMFDNEHIQENCGLKILNELKRKKLNIPVIIYSSKYIDVSKYQNVIDYILNDGYDLTNKIRSISIAIERQRSSVE